MTTPLRYLSVCSGIEAATVAWEPLGWQAAGYAEIDPFASRDLHHHYSSGRPRVMPDPAAPDLPPKERAARRAAIKAVSRLPERANGVPNFGDFTAIDPRDLGPVDLLVGGTPCQAFSIAGKRLSLTDARGNLSLAFTVLAHELARSHGLRWAVWENVPGVLSTKDNAFGCFLGSLVGHDGAIPAPRGNKWPDAGMVGGPWARAAWIVRDAQYFRLAQRRRRVFVVAGFGDGADPAAVLLERHGLRRHPPARGEAREGVAATLTRGAESRGRGGYAGRRREDDANLIAGTLGTRSADHPSGVKSEADFLVAYGGNNTTGPIDVATAVNAHGGPNGRQDFESETFVCFDARQTDVLVHGDLSAPLDTKFPGPAIAFDTTQITHPENRSNPQPGDPCHPLAAHGHVPAVAFGISCDAFDRSGEGVGKTAAARSGLGISNEMSPTLRANRPNGVAHGWAVRRLMPVETERLQGFPDGYTSIPGASDGPRYKTHGNSMAVPCMRWIGGRIAQAEQAAAGAPRDLFVPLEAAE